METIKHVSTSSKLLDGFKMEVKAGNHTLFIDQPVASGGTDSGPSPLEYLQFALSGCLGAVASMIARQQRIDLRGMQITIEGDLDINKFLGKPGENRPGFLGLKVVVDIDADMTPSEKKAFLAEMDARCPISDNILHETPVQFVIEEGSTIYDN